MELGRINRVFDIKVDNDEILILENSFYDLDDLWQFLPVYKDATAVDDEALQTLISSVKKLAMTQASFG